LPDESELTISTSTGSYPVRLGAGQLTDVVSSADVLLVDSALTGLLPSTDRPVITVEASEDTKTLAGCERVVLQFQAAGVRRGQRLVAVGGGVVQDVGTFVADVYMRGLPWSYVPTTLMAMADSCIGGKSSINVGEVKNLVGSIYPPQSVHVDPVFLDTLGPVAVAAGLSEAAKIAYCRGSSCFQGYLDCFARFDGAPLDLISHVLRAKKWFIEVDEHDRAERRLLNFGHTFGHALESAVDHVIPHGLAVSIGVLCASSHPAVARNPAVEALREHCLALLAMAPQVVSDAVVRFDPSVFERALRSDKKHTSESLTLILPATSGGVEERHLPATAITLREIVDTTERTLDLLRSMPW
jgi:3-dehydroquinate synthase